MSRQSLRLAVAEATTVLTRAGVPSARNDAELLAAHLLRVERGELPMVPLVDLKLVVRYRELVARRATRVPLQHLTGSGWLGHVELLVGPGVFIPRPETELLLAWALGELTGRTRPVVLDLCTGSGALALGLAHARPDAVVHAVELEPAALSWARRNAERQAVLGDRPIRLHHGDVTDRRLLVELEGGVDVIVANPPYVPVGSAVAPEVADHDPAVAVFAGADGLAVIRPLVGACAGWLRVGGVVGVEHDESHAVAVAELFGARAVYADVVTHDDLAGRPRFTTASRVSRRR